MSQAGLAHVLLTVQATGTRRNTTELIIRRFIIAAAVALGAAIALSVLP